MWWSVTSLMDFDDPWSNSRDEAARCPHPQRFAIEFCSAGPLPTTENGSKKQNRAFSCHTKIKRITLVRWPLFSETGLEDPWRNNDDEAAGPSLPVGSKLPSAFVFKTKTQIPGVWLSLVSQMDFDDPWSNNRDEAARRPHHVRFAIDCNSADPLQTTDNGSKKTKSSFSVFLKNKK